MISSFWILCAAVGIVAIVVIMSPETILPVNFYAIFPISGITAILGGVIAFIGIKKIQNIGLVSKALIIFSGSIISLIGIGLLVFILLIYAAD
jgi:hypothetical protein